MTTAYERDMAQARAEGRTAQVQVFAPCSCSACIYSIVPCTIT